MKKSKFFLGIVLMLLVWVPVAGATSYSETFLGAQDDDNRYNINEGFTAQFGFNLTAAGDYAKLYDEDGHYVHESSKLPTTDVTTFLAPQNIGSAFLNFTFSDKDTSQELVRVFAGIISDDTQIYSGWFDLGYRAAGYFEQEWHDGYWHGGGPNRHWHDGYYTQEWHEGELTREYVNLSIDLVGLGLGSYLADGQFLSLVLAPEVCNLDNNFRIEQANLMVETATVPEPTSMLLLGLGLLGVAGIRRFKK